jgi:hypothetical protein
VVADITYIRLEEEFVYFYNCTVRKSLRSNRFTTVPSARRKRARARHKHTLTEVSEIASRAATSRAGCL